MARRRALLSAVLAVGVLAAAGCASSDAPPGAAGTDAPAQWSRVTLGHPYNEPTAHVDALERIDVNRTGLWLALGTQSDRPGARQKPGAWASSDDRNWRSIGIPVGPDDVGAVATAASAGPLGLVGGSVGTGDDAVPSLWSSSTGWEWTGPTALPLPSDRKGVTVRAITPGPGGWVAVGGAVTGGAAAPIFWYSADGRQWALGDAGALPGGSVGTSVAASGDRYVAVVTSTTSDPSVVVSSADGRTWQREAIGAGDPPSVVGDVVRVRDWFVVPVDARRLAVSRDGSTWQPGLTLAGLPGLPGVDGGGAAAPVPVIELHDRGGSLVASAGSADQLWLWSTSNAQDLSDASAPVDAVWRGLAPPPDPDDPYRDSPSGTGTARVATAGPTMVVVRPGGREQATWWTASDDGQWGRAVTDIPPPVRQWREAVEALAADAGTVVAVGRADYRDPARSEGRAWFSSGTMQQWEEVIVNGNITDVLGVASDGNRFVAVATKGDAPVVLRSAEGRAWDEIDGVVTDPSSTTTTQLGAGPGDALFGGDRPTAIAWLGGRYLVQTRAGGLWSSPDGIRWTPVDVAGDGSVPRGPLCASSGAGVDVPFRSTDGSAWTRDSTLDAVTGDVCAVAADGTALALGEDEAGLHGWLAVPGEATARSVDSAGLGVIDGVASKGTAWMALGSTSVADPQGDPGVWTSATGTGDWLPITAAMRLLREPGPGTLSAALAFNGRQLLGGTSGDAATVLLGPA